MNAIKICLKWSVRIILVILGVVIIWISYKIKTNMFYYDMNVVEASLAVLADGTRWAPGFSECRFGQLKEGMTFAEVRDLLGEPLMVGNYRNEPKSWWDYAIGRDDRWMSNSSYSTHQRTVVFNQTGHVIEFYRDFYFD